MTRIVDVPIARLERWIDGFATRHGTPIAQDGGALLAPDGASAIITAWRSLDLVGTVAELIEVASPPQHLAVLLVRRGGYAVARTDGSEIVAKKVGRRHVQSRTAAGGWSQQRFARRRGNQADELVSAVAGHAERILLTGPVAGLVRGGDRTLAAGVLAAPRLRALGDLPTRDLYDLPDPDAAVLGRAIDRARSVRIAIEEPRR